MTKIIPLAKSNIIEFDSKKMEFLYNKSNKKSLKEELLYLDSRQNILIKQKKIVQALLDNNINSLKEIKNITSSEVRGFLLDKDNFQNISSFLPKVPDTINVIKTTQLSISQIPEPTQEILQKMSKSFGNKMLYYKWEQFLNNQYKVEPNDAKLPDLSLDQAKDLYYKTYEISVLHQPLNKKLKSQYISNLTNQELYNHYQSEIAELNLELGYLRNIIKTLKENLDKIENSKLLATPNILPRIVEGKTKDMSLFDLYKTKQNDIKDLLIILQSVAPDIYNKLADYRKEELESYILENSQEIITYIDGAKLTILEDRAFCSLRFCAVEDFEQGLVVSPSTKITRKLSDIYKLSGVHYDNGYDTKQRRAIKDAITNPDGNLIKRIHIEYSQIHKDGNAILSTNFIKYIDWNDEKDQVTYEIDSMFFVNVPDKPLKGHWSDDIEGRNRFITKSFKNGFQNICAYRLHRYIASSLRKKTKNQDKNQEYNVSTLLEHSGLITDFNRGSKTLALSKLQEYLDKMYEHETLIKNKPIRVNSKSDKYGKYKLERLW